METVAGQGGRWVGAGPRPTFSVIVRNWDTVSVCQTHCKGKADLTFTVVFISPPLSPSICLGSEPHILDAGPNGSGSGVLTSCLPLSSSVCIHQSDQVPTAYSPHAQAMSPLTPHDIPPCPPVGHDPAEPFNEPLESGCSGKNLQDPSRPFKAPRASSPGREILTDT